MVRQNVFKLEYLKEMSLAEKEEYYDKLLRTIVEDCSLGLQRSIIGG